MYAELYMYMLQEGCPLYIYTSMTFLELFSGLYLKRNSRVLKLQNLNSKQHSFTCKLYYLWFGKISGSKISEIALMLGFWVYFFNIKMVLMKEKCTHTRSFMV